MPRFAAVAATAGGMIGYLIGRSVGLPLLVRYGRRIGLDERRLKVGQYLFLRHGGKIVFFGRFVAFLRVFAALLAGKLDIKGKVVVAVLSGGNVDAELFHRLIAA